jgi:hypothetical protein
MFLLRIAPVVTYALVGVPSMRPASSLPASASWEIAADVDPTQAVFSLRFHTVQLKIFSNYENHLEEVVFTRRPNDLDEKLFKKYCRILKKIDAYKILAFLWKESEFIGEEVMAQLGLRKSYKGKSLTAHHLAADLAETGAEVAALNSRIRIIAIAASNFGLVDRESLNSTTVILKGTALLHQFMTGLATQNLLLLNELESEQKEASSSTEVGEER